MEGWYDSFEHFLKQLLYRSVVLGMGDGSMTTLTIADPDKPGITQYLKSLPSRNPEVFILRVVLQRD